MTEHTSFKDWALRAVAVVGLLAVLLLGAWGIIQIAVFLPSFFSDLNNDTPTSVVETKKEVIAITLPSSATSGQAFSIAWDHQNKNSTAKYAYALSYACGDAVVLQAPTPVGTYQDVACDTTFNYTNATQSMPLMTKATATAAKATITVLANNLETGAITASNSATITITGGKTTTTAVPTVKPTVKPTTSTTQPTQTTYVAAPKRTTLYGSPDLSVRINSATPTGSQYSLQFVVENVGTNVAPAGWMFNAQLPLNPTYTYSSQTQQALYPGDKIVYTLGFTMSNQAYTNTAYPYNNGYTYDYQNTYNYGTNCNVQYQTYPYTYPCNNTNTYPYNTYNTYYPTNTYYPQTTYGTRTVSIVVDPQNYVSESSEANNTASITI